LKKAQIQIPHGFIARREGTGLFVHSGDASFGIAPMAASSWRAAMKGLELFPDAQIEAFSVGEFTGFRVSRAGLVRSYMLRGQGKHLMLSLSCEAKIVEPLLPTLRFEDEI
jgi:hypothetical protein